MENKALTQFEKDLAEPFGNSKTMSRGEYNLILTRRDFRLYQVGLKPHRKWKFNEAKKYFGIKGNKDVAAEKLARIYKEFRTGKYDEIKI